MELIIKKIFNKYDVKLDLSKTNNILIGENGIGKSTTLKIIYLLFKGNYYELSKFIFDEIIIIIGNNEYVLKYEDLITPKDSIIKELKKGIFNLELFEETGEIVYWSEINKAIDDELDSLRYEYDDTIVGGHVYKTRKNRKLNDDEFRRVNELKEIRNKNHESVLKDMERWEKFIKSLESMYESDYQWLFREIIKSNCVFSERFLRNVSKHWSCIADVTLYKYIKQFIDKFEVEDGYVFNYGVDKNKMLKFAKKLNFDSFIINMASDYDVLINSSSIYAFSDLEEELNDEDIQDADFISSISRFTLDDELISSCYNYKKIFNKYTINYLIDNYKFNIDDYNYREELFSANSERVKLDVNNILFDMFYNRDELKNDAEFIKIIAKSYYETMKEFLDGEYDNEMSELKEFNHHMVVKVNVLVSFFYGFFPENSFINKLMMKYLVSTSSEICEIKLISYVLCKLFDKIAINFGWNKKVDTMQGVFKFIDSGKIKHIHFSRAFAHVNSYFDKFSSNKRIFCSAFGIFLYVFPNGDEIDYYDLSSGEKKLLLMIILLSLPSSNTIVLLDEPENSLSVVWQKNLLPMLKMLIDFVKKEKTISLVVATQSPYIISDEEMYKEDVICLPMEL